MKRILRWLDSKLWPGSAVDVRRGENETMDEWLDRICPSPGP